jgi:hypothetical protein
MRPLNFFSVQSLEDAIQALREIDEASHDDIQTIADAYTLEGEFTETRALTSANPTIANTMSVLATLLSDLKKRGAKREGDVWTAATPGAMSEVSRRLLSEDTIFWVSLDGNDFTGDGTEANPWYSVHYAFGYILTYIDCNGFAPVVMMKPGDYNPVSYAPDVDKGLGMMEPGILNWGAAAGKQPNNNVVDPGGALLELCEPLVGKQVTGGQPIRLCGAYQGEAGTSVIIQTVGTCIAVLHAGKLVVAGLTLRSTNGSCLYATQGGVIEVGTNVRFAHSASGHLRAENGGSIITTGNYQIVETGGQSHATAAKGHLVFVNAADDLASTTGGWSAGPHAYNTAFVYCTKQGMVDNIYTWPRTGITHSTKQYYIDYQSMIDNGTNFAVTTTAGTVAGTGILTFANNFAGEQPTGTNLLNRTVYDITNTSRILFATYVVAFVSNPTAGSVTLSNGIPASVLSGDLIYFKADFPGSTAGIVDSTTFAIVR